MIILWYSSLHDPHMMCSKFNNGGINKGSGINELVRPNKTFEYEDTRSGAKLKPKIYKRKYTKDNSCKYNKVPGAFSNKFLPDINYFTDCFTDCLS